MHYEIVSWTMMHFQIHCYMQQRTYQNQLLNSVNIKVIFDSVLNLWQQSHEGSC
jgi:hypothetical protein